MTFADNFILLSYINTKLRDEFSSLDDLCATLGYDKEEIVSRLKSAGYEYNEDENKFIGV